MENKENLERELDELQYYLIVTTFSESLFPVLACIDDIPLKYQIIWELVDEYSEMTWISIDDREYVKMGIGHMVIKNEKKKALIKEYVEPSLLPFTQN